MIPDRFRISEMTNVKDAALARAMQENAEPEDSAVKQPAAFKLFAKGTSINRRSVTAAELV